MSGSWSFKESLGDTIMEKYEAFYVRLHEVFGQKNGPYVAPDWVMCGSDVALIFESSSTALSEKGSECQDEFYKLGRVNNKFDVYVDRILGKSVYVGLAGEVRRLVVEDLFI